MYSAGTTRRSVNRLRRRLAALGSLAVSGSLLAAPALAHPGHEIGHEVATLDDLLHTLGHLLGNPAVFLLVVALVVGVRLSRTALARVQTTHKNLENNS